MFNRGYRLVDEYEYYCDYFPKDEEEKESDEVALAFLYAGSGTATSVRWSAKGFIEVDLVHHDLETGEETERYNKKVYC